MHKLLISLLILIMLGYVGISKVNANETIKTDIKRLETFCGEKTALIQKLLYEVVDTNHKLYNMIRDDVGDFVPILFSQFKMENLSIMLFSVLVETLRTAKDGEVFNITLDLLSQYIELIRYDLIKTKMFEGMIGNSNSIFKTKEQLVLTTVKVNLEVAYDLLVQIKEGLEELKGE